MSDLFMWAAIILYFLGASGIFILSMAFVILGNDIKDIWQPFVFGFGWPILFGYLMLLVFFSLLLGIYRTFWRTN